MHIAWKFFNDNNINIINIKSGCHHMICLSDKNNAYCFGENKNGQ